LPPGLRCRRSNGSNEGGNTKAEWAAGERRRGKDERKRKSGRLERMGDGERRMKNAIMILKNGLGLSRERKRE